MMPSPPSAARRLAHLLRRRLGASTAPPAGRCYGPAQRADSRANQASSALRPPPAGPGGAPARPLGGGMHTYPFLPLLIWPQALQNLLPQWLLWVLDGVLLLIALWVLLKVFRMLHAFGQSRALRSRINSALLRARLSEEQYDTLRRLAGGGRGQIYRMLANPWLFESRIHRRYTQNEAAGLDFLPGLRKSLGYTSANSSTAVVATRQLTEGDLCQIIFHHHGVLHELYGVVAVVEEEEIVLRMSEKGMQTVMQSGDESVHIGVLLDRGRVVCHFPLNIVGQDVARQGLRATHTLLDSKRTLRTLRLPILRNVVCRMRLPDLQGNSEEQQREALLIDVSEGGFSLLLTPKIPPQTIVSFWLPVKSVSPIPLVGTALECNEQSPGWWIARFSLSRMDNSVRKSMELTLRREFQRRLNRLEGELAR